MIKKILFTIGLLILSSCKIDESAIRAKVIQLSGNHHACSGTQIQAPSGANYILTAGHCKVLAEDGAIWAQVDAERKIPRKIIEESPDTDLLLLEGMPEMEGLPIAKSIDINDKLVAYTHGLKLATYKTEGTYIQDIHEFIPVEYINNQADEDACLAKPKYKAKDLESLFGTIRVCGLDIDFFVADLVTITHGSSGGFIGNTKGELVSVVSAGMDERFCLSIPLKDIQEFLQSY